MNNDLILVVAVLALLALLLTATLQRRRPSARDFEESVGLDETYEEEVVDDLEEFEKEFEERAEEPEGEVDRAPQVSRLAQGLAKTRNALATTIKGLTGRDKLDSGSWEEIEEALIRADVGTGATERIIEALQRDKVDPAGLTEALRAELLKLLSAGDRSLNFVEGKPSVWLVIGVNGVGKTTSIAKLAHRIKADGHSVVLAAGDTFRAAAIEQLGTWAERLDIHMVKHQAGSDPSAVVFDAIEHATAKNVEVVVADTAGRLHTKANLMEELKKIRRVVEREAGEVGEALLVLDATVGQNGLAQAKAFHEAIGATGVILSKLDGSAKGGIVLSVQEQLGIPVKFIGVGEGVEDLEEFDPESFVDALLAES